jgi:hypothetical protein
MEGLVIYDSKTILQSTNGPFNGHSKGVVPQVVQLLSISRVMPRTIF